MDLFEHPNLWSPKLIVVLKKYESFDYDYNECDQLVNDLNEIGYDCEYYLDAVPFNLHKIQLDEFDKEKVEL